MRLNRATYYSDFVVYPLLILTLADKGLRHAPMEQRLDWLTACAAGIAIWTLAEYLLHRFVLHRVVFLERMHDLHHDNPTDLVGTPIWISLPAVLAILLFLWGVADAPLAAGLTCGLTAGYLCYITVHHIVHHRRVEHGSYLYRLKRRHAMHHYAPSPCNYGVTTNLWDRLLGTADPSASFSFRPQAIRNRSGAAPRP